MSGDSVLHASSYECLVATDVWWERVAEAEFRA